MLKRSILLGAVVWLADPLLAAAQSPSPPDAAASDAAAPDSTSQGLDEPAASPPSRSLPPLRSSPSAAPATRVAVSSDASLHRSSQRQPSRDELPSADRSGVTFELGFGIGGARAAQGGGASDTFGEVLGINAGLGVWFTPSTALTFRVAGNSVSREVFGEDVRYTAGQIGLGVQQMVSRRVWLGGGGGVAILTSDQEGSRSDGGPSVNLRAGVNLYGWQRL
jgi:hypothetical protein